MVLLARARVLQRAAPRRLSVLSPKADEKSSVRFNGHLLHTNRVKEQSLQDRFTGYNESVSLKRTTHDI